MSDFKDMSRINQYHFFKGMVRMNPKKYRIKHYKEGSFFISTLEQYWHWSETISDPFCHCIIMKQLISEKSWNIIYQTEKWDTDTKC